MRGGKKLRTDEEALAVLKSMMKDVPEELRFGLPLVGFELNDGSTKREKENRQKERELPFRLKKRMSILNDSPRFILSRYYSKDNKSLMWSRNSRTLLLYTKDGEREVEPLKFLVDFISGYRVYNFGYCITIENDKLTIRHINKFPPPENTPYIGPFRSVMVLQKIYLLLKWFINQGILKPSEIDLNQIRGRLKMVKNLKDRFDYTLGIIPLVRGRFRALMKIAEEHLLRELSYENTAKREQRLKVALTALDEFMEQFDDWWPTLVDYIAKPGKRRTAAVELGKWSFNKRIVGGKVYPERVVIHVRRTRDGDYVVSLRTVAVNPDRIIWP